jgi:hypothetical protein
MKTFRQFIIEARETQASQMAKQRGLRGNGHGDWYDATGKLVAKTVGGELKIFSGREGKGPKEKKDIQQQISEPIDNIQQEPQDNQEVSKGIVIVFGRFNPPGKSHEQMLKFGYSRAKENNYEFRIYPSRIQDAGTNPLNPSLKVQFMQMMYPDYADYILDSEDAKTIFDVLQSLYSDGYEDVIVVVGAERLGEFQSLAHKGEGQGYEFKNIEVLASPGKDPDSDTSGAGSSAALRTSAAEGNYQAFASNLPGRMKKPDREALFNAVSKSMKRGVNESIELWKIAPELDMETLRMNYRKNNLYPVGSLVENLNTGLVGEVKRRGTNYLICVTEDGLMFKSWLQNVRNVQEDVYEVGTDKYRKFLQKLTPGQPIQSYSSIKIKETIPKSINKLRRELSKAGKVR